MTGRILWVAGWLVLAVGASSLSGYGDELAVFSVVISLGIIVSVIMRRLTAAHRAVTAEKKHVALERDIDWENLEPIPVVISRVLLGHLFQQAVICGVLVAIGYVLTTYWAMPPLKAYAIAAVATASLTALALGALGGFIEWDTRKTHARWRTRQQGKSEV